MEAHEYLALTMGDVLIGLAGQPTLQAAAVEHACVALAAPAVFSWGLLPPELAVPSQIVE